MQPWKKTIDISEHKHTIPCVLNSGFQIAQNCFELKLHFDLIDFDKLILPAHFSIAGLTNQSFAAAVRQCWSGFNNDNIFDLTVIQENFIEIILEMWCDGRFAQPYARLPVRFVPRGWDPSPTSTFKKILGHFLIKIRNKFWKIY